MLQKLRTPKLHARTGIIRKHLVFIRYIIQTQWFFNASSAHMIAPPTKAIHNTPSRWESHISNTLQLSSSYLGYKGPLCALCLAWDSSFACWIWSIPVAPLLSSPFPRWEPRHAPHRSWTYLHYMPGHVVWYVHSLYVSIRYSF